MVKKLALVLIIFTLGYLFNDVTNKLRLHPIKEAQASILWSKSSLLADEDFTQAVREIVFNKCWYPNEEHEFWKQFNARKDIHNVHSMYRKVRCGLSPIQWMNLYGWDGKKINIPK